MSLSESRHFRHPKISGAVTGQDSEAACPLLSSNGFSVGNICINHIA